MKFKGLVFALAVCILLFGCGGSGGTSTNINLRTVILVHTANFLTDTITVSGSSSGTIAQNVAPSESAFNLVSSTSQTFTATDTSASPNIPLGTGAPLTSPTVNGFYTLYVTGIEGNTGQFAPAVAVLPETLPTPTSSAALIRYANFSTSATNVDVYFTASPSSSLSGVTPTFSSAAYGTPTSYVQLPAGAYYVRITQAGNSSNVLYTSPGAATFVNGFVYTNYGWDSSPTTPYVITQQDIY